MYNQNYQRFEFNENPTTLEEEASLDPETNDADDLPNENNILLERALSMINKLSGICAKISNINPSAVSDASEFLNDPSLFDFFIQRVEAGIEVEKVAKSEVSRQTQKYSPQSKSNQRISPDTYFFIKQVQNQIVSLKNTLHSDHMQLIQSLFDESASDSLLSDNSSLMDQ